MTNLNASNLLRLLWCNPNNSKPQDNAEPNTPLITDFKADP